VIDAVDAAFVNQWRWCLDHGMHGYARRSERVNGRPRTVKLHRALMGLTYGDGFEVDHIDRNPLNNRRNNLRVVPSKAAQRQNLSSYAGSSSSYRGVGWDKNRAKWQARIKVRGKLIYLGHFDDEADAGRAALAARARLMPYAVD
jgi:hypothetical protein